MQQTLPDPAAILSKLRELQRHVRRAVLDAHDRADNAEVRRASAADTIYGIDAVIEPVIEAFLEHWGRTVPMVVVCEGLEPESGRVFPKGLDESRAVMRLILDPVDGTRGLMYDKRAAWSLAGAAPNKGPATRLSDIEVAVMTELPTSKMSRGDVLWAIRGRGAHAAREDVFVREGAQHEDSSLIVHPSQATSIEHGFAMVANFFPGTKVLASQLMEHIIERLIPAAVGGASVFEDQYICTGGQLYELITGHDRFNADLRPIFYAIQKQPMGLCCHPYDCAGWLIAQEAGVVLTDGLGGPLDARLDVTSPISWAGYANAQLHRQIEPLLSSFLRQRMSSV
jgi:fructose-1,6-bisphosphatase/inositol monophosphatase family enzyme